MIEQSVQTIKIADIKIKNRQRKKMDDKEFFDHIQALANSIKKYGLFNPIIISKEDNSLIMGFCRLQAHLHLERDEIAFRYAEDLDPFDLKMMELDENVRRKNLEWWEEAAAIGELHDLHKAIYGEEWNIAKTAAIVGKSAGTVSQSTQLAKELKENPEIRKESTLRGALNKVKTKKQIAERQKAIEKKKQGKLPSIPAELLQGDALELIRKEPDESFDAVITNFPFGIDLEFKGGETPYEDGEDYIVKLVRNMCSEIYRVLKPDSWAVTWFDVRKITYSNKQKQYVQRSLNLLRKATEKDILSSEEYAEMVTLANESLGLAHWLEEAGFSYVRLVPCVWAKPDKTQGIIGDPRKGLITSYEVFLFAAKGDAVLLKQGRQDLFTFELGSNREQSVEMPLNIIEEVLSMVVLGGARVLDPFAGSAAVGRAALNRQCEFRGYELEEERAKLGKLLLDEHIFSKGSNDAE